ncbi:hypothetical protein [Micromonospora sp. ALFpr18c]|uniref:hypothetical protein n=1 Tax=unclassified Micromonospora TaxID=2617518 RepID=UPI001CEDD1C6|nr:hypothetical protein [Micromonospora sp. ALFpr18c]
MWLVTRPSGGSASARHRAEPAPVAPVADPTPTRVDQEPVRDTDTVEQPTPQPVGGPLSDEIPPASTNWKSEDPTVPTQRPAPGEVDQR